MTITYVIPGATLLDQLAPTTLDGLPANDANDDCVPTSIAEGLHILTGQTFDGDELKDSVYGAGYVGTMAASAFVAYCAAHGVTLAPHDGSQAALIATVHSEVSTGHPVVLTMPSQWGTAPADPMNPGSSHVGIAVGIGPGEIRVMNPWHGFYQDAPDDWWQARLCYGQVWIMSASNSGLGGATVWTRTATGAKDGAGHIVGEGIANAIFAQGWQASDGLTSEHYYSASASITALANGHTLGWNGSLQVDLAGSAVAALLGQLTSANAEIAALKAAPAPTPAPAPLTSKEQAAINAVAALASALGLA